MLFGLPSDILPSPGLEPPAKSRGVPEIFASAVRCTLPGRTLVIQFRLRVDEFRACITSRKVDCLALRACGTAPLATVTLVIEAHFCAPNDPPVCTRSAGERCFVRGSICLIFVHVDVFVRIFDSQQRTQATKRTKLSLLVRSESDREYGPCPITSRRRQQFVGEAPGNHSGL